MTSDKRQETRDEVMEENGSGMEEGKKSHENTRRFICCQVDDSLILFGGPVSLLYSTLPQQLLDLFCARDLRIYEAYSPEMALMLTKPVLAA